MRKLLFLLLVTPLFVNAQQKGEKLEQIPIAIYDKMRAFEENKHLKFLAQVPSEVYKDGDTYYMQIDDYNVSYDGFYFIAKKTDEFGNKKTYRLIVKDSQPIGTMEVVYKDGDYWLQTFHKKWSKYGEMFE